MRCRWLSCLTIPAIIASVTFSSGYGFAQKANEPVKASASAKKVSWEISRTTPPENVDELKAMQAQVKSTVEKVMPSVVGLLLFTKGSAGSGVIVNETGLVFTAAHVIEKPDLPVRVILPDGTGVEGRTLGLNSRADSGMVQIVGKPPRNASWPGAKEGKWPYVELGDSETLKRGQYVIALGHPGGPKPNRKPPVRLGQSVGLNSTSERGSLVLRTDCTLVGGDSGGPLFDMSGKLIGIHSRIGIDLESNIHVPIKIYKDEWVKLEEGERVGRIPPVMLGVKFNAGGNTSEILVIDPDSPASDAGLQVGDRVTKFNGQAVSKANDVYKLLYDLKPGNKVKVEVLRGEEKVTVEVTLAPRPTRR